ncbi:MAG: Mammalian cell entry related domain protein [Anaerosporomusa subterranea]|jgi:phospholipid/cholesterol/gamma-HCH transport system substrate-binding protein|nr:Mammalian cell entry related domain protein [Anaerosporomusa subterranea]
MSLSTEAKVGAITLIAFILLAGMIVMIGGMNYGEHGYPVRVTFTQVAGLKAGNVVRYAGVEVGKVEAMTIAPDGIEVLAKITSGAKIPKGSTFRIGSDGLLGEKFIEITPPVKPEGDLAPNSLVRGEDPAGLDQLVATADKVLKKADEMIQSMNEVIGDEKVKAALRESALNISSLTANLDALSASLVRMAASGEQDIVKTVHNLRLMSENLKNTSGRIDKLVADVDNDGRTATELKETLTNVKNASARVERMAAALEGVATDPETTRSIRETLKNARDASEKANKMLTKIDQIKTEGSVEILYSENDGDGRYQTNANLKLRTSPRNFALIGVRDIGETDKLNLQLGQDKDSWTTRFGVIDNRAGVGLDKRLGEKLALSVDFYDPNDGKVRLGGQYLLGQNFYLVGQTDNINRHSERNSYFGIKRSF